MRLWIDDVRPAPDGYVWYKRTNDALRNIYYDYKDIELIDLDHDAGDYAKTGGGDSGQCFNISSWHDNELGVELHMANGDSMYCSEGTYLLFSDASACPYC